MNHGVFCCKRKVTKCSLCSFCGVLSCCGNYFRFIGSLIRWGSFDPRCISRSNEPKLVSESNYNLHFWALLAFSIWEKNRNKIKLLLAIYILQQQKPASQLYLFSCKWHYDLKKTTTSRHVFLTTHSTLTGEADVTLWSDGIKRKAEKLRSSLKTRIDGVQLFYLRYQNVILLPYEQFDTPFIDASLLT